MKFSILTLFLCSILTLSSCKKDTPPPDDPTVEDPCDKIYESYQLLVDKDGKPLWISRRHGTWDVVGDNDWVYAYRDCGITKR